MKYSSYFFMIKISHRFFLLLLITFACNQPAATKNKEIEQLHWLIGDWDKQVKPGQTGYERWTIDTNGELKGIDITQAGTDTVSFESVTITKRNGDLYYVVNAPNDTTVAFKFTSLKDDEFTCENETHDFPKKIHYRRNGQQMKATISGDGQSIEFNFIKKSQ